MQPIDFLYRAGQIHGDRIAISATERQLTYTELIAQVDALAAALQQKDPTPGSRVALCAANSVEHIVAMLAIMAAGKVWVPLNYRSTPSEIKRILDAIEPGAVIVDDAGSALVREHDNLALHFSCLPELFARFKGQAPVRHARSRDDTQAIKFTGGTTGLPKGVMQPCRAWLAGIINQIAGWQISSDDQFVICAPVSHGTGTYVLPLLAQGGRLVLCASNSARDIARAFQNGGTMTFMPPTLIYKLMAEPGLDRSFFPGLRLLIYGGAGMPTEKITKAQAFFGPVIATTYGQTEAPQIAARLGPDDLAQPANLASVGRASWLTDIAILSPEGVQLPPVEIGHVAIRGDLVMTGYWKLPEKTAETIRDGWLLTGDAGYLDERGFLFLKERLRDVIITGGFNVYPIDVENAFSSHPAVHEAAVFGVKDDKWGEAVTAAIEFKSGRTATEDELKAFVRDKLGPVHTPKNIRILRTLPRSPVGKVLKNVLKAEAVGRPETSMSKEESV